jgi:hypothetical protein
MQRKIISGCPCARWLGSGYFFLKIARSLDERPNSRSRLSSISMSHARQRCLAGSSLARRSLRKKLDSGTGSGTPSFRIKTKFRDFHVHGVKTPTQETATAPVSTCRRSSLFGSNRHLKGMFGRHEQLRRAVPFNLQRLAEHISGRTDRAKPIRVPVNVRVPDFA